MTTDPLYTDADVRDMALCIVGHPDAMVGSRHMAAARAVLDALASRGRLLPVPLETRCPNCDHVVTTHGVGGCWFTLSSSSIGENLVCGCEQVGPWVPVDPDTLSGADLGLGRPTASDLALVAAATGEGIRSIEIQPEYEDDDAGHSAVGGAEGQPEKGLDHGC